jgi:apolipoprotein N-acyltransferase
VALTKAERLFAGRWAPLLALLAGAALPLAFEPFDLSWLALICPAVLFAVTAAAPAKRALWSGYLFSLGFYGVGISWLYVSIGEYGDGGPVVGVIATAAFVAFMAVFPWLAIVLARRLRGGTGLVAVAVAFPVAWLLLEWLRTWFMTGFPWLLLGYSQTDSLLTPVAPVFGVLGVSTVLAFLAGLLARVLLAPSLRRGGAFALALLAALGLARMLEQPWTAPAGEPLKVALLQGNIAQDKKWDPGYFRETLERYVRLTESHWGADLIVWPEAAVPTYHDIVLESFFEPLGEMASEHGTDLLIGVPVREPDGRAYNAVVSLSGEPGVYYKRFLVPFGEYLPLRDFFGQALDLLGAPMSDFSAGVAATPLHAAGYAIGVTVCYEVVYGPELAEVLPEAKLLVNVSNDAWFGDSLAPHQHLQMARMRAIETGRYMLRATNTGITAVIDHHGRIVEQAPQFKVASLAAQAVPRQGATPYVRWLDWPVLGLLAALFLSLLALRRFR